jgi:glycosyltransferase involved in cell wall biosynthesis
MLSVADIGQLKKPIVWTLHDMWAFCGGEHYAPDDESARFRQGYLADNRPPGESGPDLNRLTWEAKRRLWAHQHFTIVCPSHWLARCARESVLFTHSHVHVIPSCLDTLHTWRSVPRDEARKQLGLPLDKKLILFGADGGVKDPRKGGDLLREGLARVVSTKPHLYELLIFGQSKPNDADSWPCNVHWLGAVYDDHQLVLAYSAADVMVVPSRQDNLPNTAVEAQACGVPVAAFNIGGLPDIVTHRVTGWLAKAFDATDLAEGVMWLIEDEARYAALAAAARKQAVERFSEPVVTSKYTELYRQVLTRFNSPM